MGPAKHPSWQRRPPRRPSTSFMGPLEGLGRHEQAAVCGNGLRLAARFDSAAGVIFGHFSMGKLHNGACETPFLATKTAATPLHFIYGPIGGIGKA